MAYGNLHKKICTRVGWYKNWHSKRCSKVVHYLAVLAFILVSAGMVAGGVSALEITKDKAANPWPVFYIPKTAVQTVKNVIPAITYTVKAGDSLWGIASDKLGNGFRYKEIVANSVIKYPSLKTSSMVDVGWVLVLKKAQIEEIKTGGEIIEPVSGGQVTEKIFSFLDFVNSFALWALGFIAVGLVARYVVWRL